MPVEHDNATETVGAHDAATMTADSDVATMAGERASVYQRVDVGTSLGGYQLVRRNG
jgi:hypothetical protein